MDLGKCSRSLKWVMAGFPELEMTWEVGSWGFGEMGESTVPCSGKSPESKTSAKYFLTTFLEANWDCKNLRAVSFLAVMMTPEVS